MTASNSAGDIIMNAKRWLKWAGGLGLAGISLFVPVAQAAPMGLPGTINYVEGQVSLDGNHLGTQQSGSVAMQNGQVLSTAQGKAEILLSPGAYLRVGDNSEVRMLNTGLSDPRIEVVRGEAMVEVDYRPKMAGIDVMERGADTSILKEGLYKFDSDEGRVEVIDGKANITDNGRSKDIGKGRELVLNGAPLKAVSFDTKTEDDLYRWSDVRASYEAEANVASAQTVYAAGGWGMGYGPGWFWNPYFDMYAWLPGDGFFYSPFGYPFFSPGYVVYAPRFYGGRGAIGTRAFAGRTGVASSFRGGAAAAHFSGGGFRGGSFGGGGFRGGGGGGFHGGGGGRR
jgi:hypothetical protein